MNKKNTQLLFVYMAFNAIIYALFSIGSKTFNYQKWQSDAAWVFVSITVFITVGFLIYVIETFFKSNSK